MNKQIAFPIGCLFFCMLLVSATGVCRFLTWFAYENEDYHKFKLYNGLSLVFACIACFMSLGTIKWITYAYLSVLSVWSIFGVTWVILGRMKKVTGSMHLFGEEPIKKKSDKLSTNLGASVIVYGFLIVICTFFMYTDMFSIYDSSKPKKPVMQQIPVAQ